MTQESKNYLLLIAAAMLAVGAVGLLCGYFGPLVLNPDANLGPLLGIFLTGPLGVLIGAVFGIVASIRGMSRLAFSSTLVVLMILTAVSTLYLCLPSDRFQDFVIDAETVACNQPTQFLDEATKRWERSNAESKWSIPRPGWKESIREMTERDRGVVLTMLVHRRWDIYEQRKPWNRGRLVSRSSKKPKSERYFGRASCDGRRIGERARYAPQWEASQVTPPDILPTFLGLYVLNNVPARYRALLNR